MMRAEIHGPQGIGVVCVNRIGMERSWAYLGYSLEVRPTVDDHVEIRAVGHPETAMTFNKIMLEKALALLSIPPINNVSGN